MLSHSKLLQTPTWHRHLFLKSTINIHNFIQLVLCRLSLWFVSQSKAFFFVPVLFYKGAVLCPFYVLGKIQFLHLVSEMFPLKIQSCGAVCSKIRTVKTCPKCCANISPVLHFLQIKGVKSALLKVKPVRHLGTNMFSLQVARLTRLETLTQK